MHSFPVDVICGCLASFVLTILLPDSPLGAAPLPLHRLGELEQLGGVALAQGGGREGVGQAEGEEHLIVKIGLEEKSDINSSLPRKAFQQRREVHGSSWGEAISGRAPGRWGEGGSLRLGA